MRKPDLKGLTKLAQAIRRTPKKHFNMGDWWKKAPCGTSGCIAGHAATLFPHRFKKVSTGEYGCEPGVQHYYVEHRRTGRDGEEAFADGFHIPEDMAAKLTMTGMRRTQKQAANAIMALVGKLRKNLKK